MSPFACVNSAPFLIPFPLQINPIVIEEDHVNWPAPASLHMENGLAACARLLKQGQQISFNFFCAMVQRVPTQHECQIFRIDGVESPPYIVMDNVPFAGSNSFSPEFQGINELPLLEEDGDDQQRGRPLRQTRHAFGGRSYQNKRSKRSRR